MQKKSGHELCCLRLWLELHTVTDLFVNGCGAPRYSTKKYLPTVMSLFITVDCDFGMKNSYYSAVNNGNRRDCKVNSLIFLRAFM